MIIAAALLLTILIGPLLIPVSTSGNLEAREIGYTDSQYIEVNGVDVHYRQSGSGEPTFILLHGTLATTYTWEQVVGSLSEMGTVIAYDRPAFGLSERPMPGEWRGESPYGYDAQVELLIGLMDELGIDQAVLVGNSMGGSIAALAAQTYPDRVQSLVLVAAANDGHGVPPVAGWLASTPQFRRIGPLFVRQKTEGFALQVLDASWHDPSHIPAQTVTEYSKALRIRNWDRALWELIAAARPFEMLLHPNEIEVPTLVIVGNDDRVIGTETVIAFGEQIPDVEIAIIENCGHVPQEECPEEFMAAMRAYDFSP